VSRIGYVEDESREQGPEAISRSAVRGRTAQFSMVAMKKAMESRSQTSGLIFGEVIPRQACPYSQRWIPGWDACARRLCT
jgi:hypothetical protein